MGILEGKAAVVTGAGRGVGKGHCMHLVKNGASVVVNDILLEEAEKVVEELKAMGGNALSGGAEDLVAGALQLRFDRRCASVRHGKN